MIKPLDQLQQEHQLILQVLKRLEDSANGGVPSPQLLKLGIEFLQAFVDRVHHGKEEHALFPIMLRNPVLRALAETMMAEHLDGENLAARVRRSLQNADDIRTVQRAILAYGDFLRDHIAKEDEIVFDAAARHLTPEEQEQLATAFEDIDVQEHGTSAFVKFLSKVDAQEGMPALTERQPAPTDTTG